MSQNHFYSLILLAFTLSACAPVYEAGMSIQPALKLHDQYGKTVSALNNPQLIHEDYRFGVSDVISVKFPRRPAFSDSCLVRADGKISVPWLGSVQVAGITADQLQKSLTMQYNALINSAPGPEVRKYLLQANDLIELRFPFYPELNSEVLVRSDGRISLLMVGEILAEGKTTELLQSEIKQRYIKALGKHDIEIGLSLKDPRTSIYQYNGQMHNLPDPGLTEVIVNLVKAAPPLIYVGGDVPAPGAIPFVNNIGALQAIYTAGGPTLTGDIRSVVILRRNSDNSVVRIVSDLSADIDGRGTNDNVLMPYDIVVVPRSKIAKVGDALDQYLYRTLKPLANSSVGMFFTHQVGSLRQIQTINQ